jgi:uncharacterized glyoxalase superfamily protein PhnB
MLKNRSAPHAGVTPVLIVRDVREAVKWYGTVFGFVEHVQIGEGHRAQLGLPGGAELVVAEERPGGRTVPTPERRSHQIMLKVEDAAATLARATANGATAVDELRQWEYGEKQVTIADVFGHHWVLTQTVVDTAPEQWGGKTVTPRRG